MPVNEIDFYKGERKEVSAVIRPKNSNESVVIISAKYEVTKLFGDNEIVKTGECETNGNKFIVLLEFLDTGKYRLEITVAIGREVIIERADINVR